MLKVQTKNFGTVAVLSLQGQVVNGQTDILRDAVQSLSEALPETNALKLDLARVTTVDAGGLGVMLELREQFQSNGIRFELTNVPKQIRRVFEITRLDSVFQITSTVEFLPAVSRTRRAQVAIHRPQLASCA
jgi:anti-sigma B factor antagonist